MVTFTDDIAGFMGAGLRIKEKSIGETTVLLAVRKQGPDYLYYTHAFPANKSYSKRWIDSAIASLKVQSAQSQGDASYQKGGYVGVTLGGSFSFSRSGWPLVMTVQVWDKRPAGVSNKKELLVMKVGTGVLRHLFSS